MITKIQSHIDRPPETTPRLPPASSKETTTVARPEVRSGTRDYSMLLAASLIILYKVNCICEGLDMLENLRN